MVKRKSFSARNRKRKLASRKPSGNQQLLARVRAKANQQITFLRKQILQLKMQHTADVKRLTKQAYMKGVMAALNQVEKQTLMRVRAVETTLMKADATAMQSLKRKLHVKGATTMKHKAKRRRPTSSRRKPTAKIIRPKHFGQNKKHYNLRRRAA